MGSTCYVSLLNTKKLMVIETAATDLWSLYVSFPIDVKYVQYQTTKFVSYPVKVWANTVLPTFGLTWMSHRQVDSEIIVSSLLPLRFSTCRRLWSPTPLTFYSCVTLWNLFVFCNQNVGSIQMLTGLVPSQPIISLSALQYILHFQYIV